MWAVMTDSSGGSGMRETVKVLKSLSRKQQNGSLGQSINIRNTIRWCCADGAWIYAIFAIRCCCIFSSAHSKRYVIHWRAHSQYIYTSLSLWIFFLNPHFCFGIFHLKYTVFMCLSRSAAAHAPMWGWASVVNAEFMLVYLYSAIQMNLICDWVFLYIPMTFSTCMNITLCTHDEE